MDVLGIEADIIEALARYRYLALPHMMRLRRVKTDKETRAALRKLVLGKLVGERACGPVPGLGRLPSCYWLTAKGAAAYTELSGGEKAPYPSHVTLSIKQLPHRYLLLDAMVSLDLWAQETGQTIERWGIYFTTAATHLKGLNIKPDGLAVLRGIDGKARPYIIEASRGEYDGGVRHALNTLKPYLQGMQGKAVDQAIWGDEKEGGQTAARLLVVYDTPATGEAVRKGLSSLPDCPPPEALVWNRVFFKTKNDLPSFSSNWLKYSGSTDNLPDGLGAP